MRVHLVENSPLMREAQYWTLIDPSKDSRRPSTSSLMAERLPKLDVDQRSGPTRVSTPTGVSVEWHWNIGSLPTDAPIIVLAHEFFDALPVHQFEYTERGG